MPCQTSMPKRKYVKRARRSTKRRGFGDYKIARPTREYIRRPAAKRSMFRGRAGRRANYGARAAAAAAGLPSCTRLYAKSILDPSGDGSKGKFVIIW